MTSQAAQSAPIQIHISADLKPYAVSAQKYLDSLPSDPKRPDAVAVGALIFARNPTKTTNSTTDSIVLNTASDLEPHILLVQRATSDSHPGQWETPGGGCDDTDPTVLHSVAREVFEETGLHLTKVVDKTGDDLHFRTRRGLKVVKLSFEVEVLELQPGDGEATGPNIEHVNVELAEEEHQAFAWVREKDIPGYKITTDDQRMTIMEGFKQLAEREEAQKTLR